MLNKASKYYPKTNLTEVVIYDSFSPRNIYCEKVLDIEPENPDAYMFGTSVCR